MSNLYYYEGVLLKNTNKKIIMNNCKKKNQYSSQFLKERNMQREQKMVLQMLNLSCQNKTWRFMKCSPNPAKHYCKKYILRIQSRVNI